MTGRKKIIVIEDCKDCKFSTSCFTSYDGSREVGISSGGAFRACMKTMEYCPADGILSNCPLTDLPHEISVDGQDSHDGMTFADGYNTCLKDISKGD